MQNPALPQILAILQIFLAIFANVSATPILGRNDQTQLSLENDGTQAEDPLNPILYVRENLTESKYLLIDDMIITKDPSKAGLLNAAWPNAVVPYTFAMTIIPQQRGLITQAMAEIATRTCLQFRPARGTDQSFLLFQNDPLTQGCYSFVGWQNKKNQVVQLSTSCSKGNAVHEIIHAVGFFHEHTRNDRDEYIKVIYENVNPGQERNFVREGEMTPAPETTTYNLSYNYDSIMHYGKTYFSKNAEPTILPLNNPAAEGNGDNIGQRDFLSSGDVTMLNKKYNCPSLQDIEEGLVTTNKPPSNNPNPICSFPFPICKI